MKLVFLRRNRHRASLLLISGAGLIILMVLFARGMNGVKPQSEDQVAVNLMADEGVRSYEMPVLPPLRDFVSFMDSELDSSHTVGAAYTFVRSGKVEYTGTFGERKRGDGMEVDEHTLFRLASVSKGFAGALACMLEQEGSLSLDDLVVDHYPGFRLKNPASTDSITIKHLLSHTTGLVPYAFDNLVEAGVALPDIVDRLHEVDISGAPGTLYGYQNVTFSMWDPIARRATGTPYQVLMDEMIFTPLGMQDASVGEVERIPDLNMASPHARGTDGYIVLKPHIGYYNVLPAAGVNASISDMEQWLLALLGHKPSVFPDTICKSLAEPLIYTPLKYRYTRNWKPFRERYYSLGWRIYQYRGRTIVCHGGYIRGYRAEIGFCPTEDVGIAFLQNSPNNLASKVVPQFFDLWFDHQEALLAAENK
ncbi:MAG: beta-lactamase family protein [Bacteroidetes bacterium]|nr:beta-lactamase family protein [Bacteroidota bacterium]